MAHYHPMLDIGVYIALKDVDVSIGEAKVLRPKYRHQWETMFYRVMREIAEHMGQYGPAAAEDTSLLIEMFPREQFDDSPCPLCPWEEYHRDVPVPSILAWEKPQAKEVNRGEG